MALLALLLTLLGLGGVARAAQGSKAGTETAILGEVGDLQQAGLQEQTYGDRVDGADLEEFRLQILEQKRQILQARVEAGMLTVEEAEEILRYWEENQGFCCGDGWGRRVDSDLGYGRGKGRRMGAGMRHHAILR